MTALDAYQCGACDEVFEEPGGPVYECSRCSATQVEERRCLNCNIFMAKLADQSCPSCEDGEAIERVAAWEAEDGSLHLSEAEADEWDAGAPERAARAVKHKAEMDAYLDARFAERVRSNERLLPGLRALAARLGDDAPSMLGGVTYSITSIEREPDYPPCSIQVGLAELARVLLDDAEEAIAVGTDHARPYEEREAAAAALRERLIPLITNAELLVRVDDSFFGFGCHLVVDADVLIDQFVPKEPS